MDSVVLKPDKTQSALPSALLKRLAKRGIIDKQEAKKLIETAEKREKNDNEEIIAEDYDEVEEPNQYDYEYVRKPEENLWKEKMKSRMAEGGNAGYKCCPNKYNIFHKCTLFCVNKWGDGTNDPSEEYLKRKKRLLRRYPLPKDWIEVYDHGCGTHYYWNQRDDTVSWLPPLCPKSHISKCAGALRRELEESVPIDMDDLFDVEADENLKIPVSVNINTNIELIPVALKKPKSRDLDKALLRTKKERRQKRDEAGKLDPMDPAAYSDIPQGTWASGLNNEERKVCADSTATGVLYQIRPYPNPGSILASNKKNECNNDESD